MGAILSIDQGTTGTTAVLIDSKSLNLLAKVNHEFPQIYPQPGWVEHNLNDIWNTVVKTVSEVIVKASLKTSDIECIGITNQRETICPFYKDGRPIRNAIVWQDRRTYNLCQELKTKHEDSIKKKTGLPLDPYFSGTKIHWMIKSDPQVQEAISNDDCLFGTIDCYLIYKLTGCSSHKTEASNASRTLLYNIEDDKWDSELLDLFDIDKKHLPEVTDSFSKFGVTKGLGFLPDGIPITGVLGDQQSALFGQAGIERGMSKCTYGTGAFYLINTGTDVVRSKNGLLTTIAYRENGKCYYALEGSCYIAGAAVQWLRDQLEFFPESPQIEKMAMNASDEQMQNILFLPFFTGIGSPYWVGNATAAIVGLTRDTGKPELSRACLEGITLSINDLIESIEQDTQQKVTELRVDGGAVVNDLLMQAQANFSETKIIRPLLLKPQLMGQLVLQRLAMVHLQKKSSLRSGKKKNALNPRKPLIMKIRRKSGKKPSRSFIFDEIV
jgi:glycerol kinase